MKNIIKIWLLSVLLIFEFASPTNAELLLFKLGHDGEYYAVDSQTYNHESNKDQQEIREIFNEVLMVFQWPMITTHFHQLAPQTQKKYLEALKMDHGVTQFVQKMLNHNFRDKYKVHFIPTTIFELAAINSFMAYVINYEPPTISPDLSAKTSSNIYSIFPDDDIRNGDFGQNRFRDTFANDILNGLRKFQGLPNSDLFSMQLACDKFNLSTATFELFLQTTSFLVERNIGNLKSGGLEFSFCDGEQAGSRVNGVIATLIDFHDKNINLFYDNTLSKEKGFFNRLYGQENQYRTTKADYMSKSHMKYLIEGSRLDCQAERESTFLLFRGTEGFKIDDKLSSTIIDSPYKESAEDYAEAIKDWPDSLRQKYLPVTISNKPDDQRNEFYPFSLSYGNSLLAGTFHEASLGKGARALDYFKTGGYGYVLIFSMENYLKEVSHPSLRQKYLIPALHPLVGLFGKGEFFHARSKLSLFQPKKKLRGYGGLNLATTTEGEIPELDRATQGGFYVTPGIDWTTLHQA